MVKNYIVRSPDAVFKSGLRPASQLVRWCLIKLSHPLRSQTAQDPSAHSSTRRSHLAYPASVPQATLHADSNPFPRRHTRSANPKRSQPTMQTHKARQPVGKMINMRSLQATVPPKPNNVYSSLAGKWIAKACVSNFIILYAEKLIL